MNQRDFVHKKAIKTKDQHIFDKYKNARNGVTRSIRLLKQKFIYTEINKSSGSGKRMWQSLKHFLPSKKNSTNTPNYDITPDIFNSFLPPLETELSVTLMTTYYQICQLLYMKGKDVSFLWKFLLLLSLKAFNLFLIERGLIY